MEEVTIRATVEPPSRQTTHKLENTYTKKVLPHCKSFRAHNRFLNLEIQQKDLEPPGKQTLGRHNKTHTRTQEKGAVTPQETEPDLPVSVMESPVEVGVDSGLLRGQWH